MLQRLCANDVAVEPGRIVYTQWLNDRGGIEADVTITRFSETSYLVVTSAATTVRDLAWLRRHIPDEARCVAIDVTSGEACLAVMGPKSRDLMAAVTRADLSNAALPFGSCREIEVGMAPVRAHRISYVGELGLELYVAAEFAQHVMETLLAAGRAHGLSLVGLHAMDSLRLEKAYRHFGHDITDEDHVLEAGLGFAVKVDKAAGKFGGFIGREAVISKRAQGVARHLLQFKLADPGPLLYHAEPILSGGKPVGYLTSGAYGHTLGAAVGLGYVSCAPGQTAQEVAAAGRFEIEVAGDRIPAVASARAFYDPNSALMRG